MARLASCRPRLVDVAPALEVVPGMTPSTILTSGAPLDPPAYEGVQRSAIIGGALYEGLADSEEDAWEQVIDGRIELRACHDHGCVGSVAGVYTASMPVFVVEDAVGRSSRSFCTIYEGPQRERLTFGVYDEAVAANLRFIRETVAPVLKEVIRHSGPLDLFAVMRRALLAGDELHSRNTAATLFFSRELLAGLIEVSVHAREAVEATAAFIRRSDLFFLHLAMASAKLTADGARDIAGSSIVTAMTASCREFAIRVSGLGSEWFRAPVPLVVAKVFEGFSPDDVAAMPGESLIMETIGLGGSAAAAGFALQNYSGGTASSMIALSENAYRFSVGEHPELTIPYFDGRGTALGIDIFKVVETGIVPAHPRRRRESQRRSHRSGDHDGPARLLRTGAEALPGGASAGERCPRLSWSHRIPEHPRTGGRDDVITARCQRSGCAVPGGAEHVCAQAGRIARHPLGAHQPAGLRGIDLRRRRGARTAVGGLGRPAGGLARSRARSAEWKRLRPRGPRGLPGHARVPEVRGHDRRRDDRRAHPRRDPAGDPAGRHADPVRVRPSRGAGAQHDRTSRQGARPRGTGPAEAGHEDARLLGPRHRPPRGRVGSVILATRPVSPTTRVAGITGRAAWWSAGRGRADGQFVLAPGDILFPFKEYVSDPITVTVEDSRVVKVVGGAQAWKIQAYCDEKNDDAAPFTSHMGWGLLSTADWLALGMYGRESLMGMDGRCYEGNFLISTGPHPFKNRVTPFHLDLPMRDCSISVDDRPVVDRGKLVA